MGHPLVFNSSFIIKTPSVEWLDAYSEIYTDTAEPDIGVVSDADVDGDPTLKAMGSCGQVGCNYSLKVHRNHF